MNLDNVGDDLDCVRLDLSIYEVKNQKKVKTLVGQIFSGGAIQFLDNISNLGQTSRNLTNVAVDSKRERPDL